MKKKCLLIMRKDFHSFESCIRQALLEREFEVTVANDQYPEGMLGKIMGKLQVPLIFFLTYNYFVKHYLRDKSYDLAIIIRGRGINKKLIQRMSQSVSRIVGYNWDTFKFNKAPLGWMYEASSYFTFDYEDADRYGLPILELFSAMPPVVNGKVIKYEISAVGRNYVDRLRYIDNVMSILQPASFFIHLHENNVFEYIAHLIREPRLFFKYRKYVYFRPLKDADYIDAIQASSRTIDFANDNQSGITMRCYEAISLKTILISNNRYLQKSSWFNDLNAFIFQPQAYSDELVGRYAHAKAIVRNSRCHSIDDFMNDLLR